MATLAVTNDFSAGTTIVAADMNTNFSDVETFVNSSPGLVQNTLVDAKGDLLAASADNTITRLAVGTNTYVLTADSSEATGMKWAAATAGTVTSVTVQTRRAKLWLMVPGGRIPRTSMSGPKAMVD